MSATDTTTAGLVRVLTGRRVPAIAVVGPQEAVIVSVTGSGTATTCYFTVPKVSTTFKYGPAPCPAGANAGQRALVLFVGNGVGDGWIVAVTDSPKPEGF